LLWSLEEGGAFVNFMHAASVQAILLSLIKF
jgi:hypothetical protein